MKEGENQIYVGERCIMGAFSGAKIGPEAIIAMRMEALPLVQATWSVHVYPLSWQLAKGHIRYRRGG